MKTDVLQNLRRYWDTLRDGRLAPYRAELDPRKFEDALENMFILEQLNPTQLRVRLAGMTLCEMMGMEVRGMPPEAFMAADDREMFTTHLNTVLSKPSILELDLTATGSDGNTTTGKMLLLPLRSDFGEVTRVLGCVLTEEEVTAAPVHFTINNFVSTEINITGSTETSTALPGFAENAVPFRHVEASPVLRTVAGEGDATRRSKPRRGHLRIVSDDE